MTRIIPAKPEHIAAIRACAVASYARYVDAIGQKPAPMVADFARQIGEGVVWVALDADDVLQGFIVFYETEGQMMLENVAVWPSAAGHGIGKTLIEFCEAEARATGLRAVQLYTNEKMVANLSIYPHLGYREVERRVEDGFARVYFEKRL
jgi:GNAT superfamily N-acetyltransferase